MSISRSLSLVLPLVILLSSFGQAQDFDFEKIKERSKQYTVILDMEIKISLGMQTNSAKQEMMGTLVSSDGLIVFDGSMLDFDHSFSVVSGAMLKATPTRITVRTLNDQEFDAEYLGVDNITKLGFVKLTSPVADGLKPLAFKTGYQFKTGEWLALLDLLPKRVSPRLSASIGMISAILTEPELFAVSEGFRQFQMGQVIYSQQLEAIGLLGVLKDFGDDAETGAGMFDPFGEQSAPIVGVISGEKINALIAVPPMAGNSSRAWLGITLQALTSDIATFLGIDSPGGIIVNNVVKGSPADKAGLKIGDVIYKVNGEQLKVDSEDKVSIFQRKISEMEPDTPVELAVYRPGDGAPESISMIANLEAAPMPASEAPEYESQQLEFKMRDLVFADYLFYNMDEESLFGVVVTEMEPGGPAMMGGLQIGDIIQQIDGQRVTSVEEAGALLDNTAKEKPDEIILFVFRNSKTLFVNLKTGY